MRTQNQWLFENPSTEETIQPGTKMFYRQAETVFEQELEFLQTVSPEVLMEFLATGAVEAESEVEATNMVRAMLPLAIAQTSNHSLTQVSPQLSHLLADTARRMYRQPNARSFIRILPTTMRQTLSQLNQQSVQGRMITPQLATQVFQRTANHMLDNAYRSGQALQKSDALIRSAVTAYAHREKANGVSQAEWSFETPFSAEITEYEYESIFGKLTQALQKGKGWLKQKFGSKSPISTRSRLVVDRELKEARAKLKALAAEGEGRRCYETLNSKNPPSDKDINASRCYQIRDESKNLGQRISALEQELKSAK